MQLVKRSQILSLDKKKHHIHHHVTTELAVGTFCSEGEEKSFAAYTLSRIQRHWWVWAYFLISMTKRKVDIFETTVYHHLSCSLLVPQSPQKSFTATSSAHHCNFAVCSSVPTIHQHHTSGLQRTFCSLSQFLNYCLCESIFYFLFHALTDSSGYASRHPILTQCPTENWCIAWFNKAL